MKVTLVHNLKVGSMKTLQSGVYDLKSCTEEVKNYLLEELKSGPTKYVLCDPNALVNYKKGQRKPAPVEPEPAPEPLVEKPKPVAKKRPARAKKPTARKAKKSTKE